MKPYLKILERKKRRDIEEIKSELYQYIFYAPLKTDLELIEGDDDISSFDGVDDYVRFTEIDVNKEFSIEIIAKPSSTALGVLIGNTRDVGGVANEGIAIFQENSRWYLSVSDGTLLAKVTSGTGWVQDEETHLILTISASSAILYINGVVNKTQGIASFGSLSSLLDFCIGYEVDRNRRYFPGEVKRPILYQSTLTAQDVEDRYNGLSIDKPSVASYDLTTSKLGSDNVKDLSGNGNHGTSHGKCTFTRTTPATVKDYLGNIVECGVDVPRFEGSRFINDDKGWRDTLPEKAIFFDGVDDYVETANNITGTEISVSGVLNMDKVPSSHSYGFGNASNNATNGFMVSTYSDSNIRLYHDGQNLGLPIDINKNYYVTIIIKEGDYMSLYIDGELISTKNIINGGILSNSNPLYIATNNMQTSSRFWNGLIDNVIQHNIVLTGEQVMQQYLFNKKGENYLVAPENVVGAWKLDDTSSTIVDYSGNGNDGTFKSGGSEATPTLVDGVYDSDTMIDESTLKGFKREQQSTNQFTYSNVLNNATGGWTESSIETPVFVSENDSWKIIPTTGSGSKGISKSIISAPDNTDETLTIFCKYVDFQWLRLATRFKDGSVLSSYFDILNGVLGNTSGTHETKIKKYGDFYRCEVRYNTGIGATTTLEQFVRLADSNGNTNVTGDGSKYNEFKYSQIEEGSFATSYIKTEASAVTRAEDNLKYNHENNIDFNNGTCYAEVKYEIPKFSDYFVSTGSAGRLLYSDINDTNDIQIYDGTSVLINNTGIDFQDNLLPVVSSWGASDGLTIAKDGTEVTGSFDGAMETGDINIGDNLESGNVRNVKIWDKQIGEDKRKSLSIVFSLLDESNDLLLDSTGEIILPN